MSLFNSVIKFFLANRLHDIERFMHNPAEVQHLVFKDLIQKARATEWGRTYGYGYDMEVQHFQDRVPISTYEQLYPYIERMLKGEQNVLWPTQIDWFSKSSGTTNSRSKYIPVSLDAIEENHNKCGKDMLCLLIENFNPNTSVFEGKSLAIGGTHQPNPFNPETRVGDVSAIITQNLPLWAEYSRAPSREISFLPNWEEKINLMTETLVDENITSLSGVPTWMLVVIKAILERTGKTNILEVWPNLEVFLHGAVAFGPYKEVFKELIPSEKFMYLELYNASEGFFGVQDQKGADDMLLMLDHGVFYEFVPLEELNNSHPKALTIQQVALDKNYAIVISTNSGLWRYMIGDTIKFTSKKPYRFKITGRTKSFINAFGEEIVVENADVAIAFACQQTNSLLKEYTAGPIYMSDSKKGGHEWIIEFEKKPDSEARFAEFLDLKLREINSDYEAKRYRGLALAMPIVRFVPEGTFYNWLKSKNKLGGQHKVPRLANHREYLDQIQALCS